ncbi:hypothetical protein [Streptomyces zagrosensis]|uniref:Uncharacterized protein n=1 Tax=Streptomyces zagrosensis TaxID=1042984 RepID=A0A7W9UZQ8_9ACTN|nr:hypothetical protein [Streptomyces zagrosensis]MBB5937007.1 hypothetical protein [Streptomyces zagrosensis]
MAETYEFPRDLLEAQEELHQVRARLLALYERLPWSVEPAAGFKDQELWRPRERPDCPGWPAAELAEVTRLRVRERELVTVVSTHAFWKSLEGPRVPAGRMALKHAHERAAAEGG